MSIGLLGLRSLVGLSDHGTLVRAAHVLRLSQPAMFRAIHDLEGALGVPLVRHKGRRLELTAAGEIAVQARRRALTALDDVAVALATLAAQPRLRVAVTSSMGPLVMSAVATFQRSAPMIRLRLQSVATEEPIAAMLSSGEIDLALGTLSQTPTGTVRVDLGDIEMVLISPPGTNLPACVTLSMLERLPLICRPPGSKERAIMDDAFIAAGILPNVVLEAEDTNAFLPAVQAGIGSTLVWRPNATGVYGVEVRPFAPAWRISAGCIFARHASPMTLRFADLLRGGRDLFT